MRLLVVPLLAASFVSVSLVRRARPAPSRVVVRAPAARVAPAPGAVTAGASGAALALSPDERLAALADGDNDQLVLVRLGPHEEHVATSFMTGAGPAQVMFVADDRVVVTERVEGAVSLYAIPEGRRLARAAVPDPYGLALAPGGRAVVVTSALPGSVTVLDARTLARGCAVDVGREPRGVVVTPDGRRALVAHVAGEPLDAVDLERCAAIALPPVPLHSEETEVYGVWMSETFTSRPRPSNAWALALDGDRVWVPFMANRTGREVPPGLRKNLYGSGAHPPTALDKTAFALAAFDVAAWRWVDAWLPEEGVRDQGHVRTPMGVARCAGDGLLHVASAGTSAAAGVYFRRNGAPRLSFTEPAAHLAQAVACARDGRLFTYSPLSHALVARDGAARRELIASPDALPDDVLVGRSLFYSATDRRVAAGGLSCAGCHPDGRDDGLTWFIRQGPRQTPSLAGRLVAPFNWNGSQPTLSGSLAQTMRRLGGHGLPLEEFNALARFVERALPPAARPPATSDAVTARGREVFFQAGCAGCHDPSRNFTDGRAHALGGLRGDESLCAFDTPSLRNVRFTAPYFHDGRYATLDAMLADGATRMGDLRAAGPDDRRALVRYLETL